MSRTAVVTGAARGIGAATVERFARAGWSVLALDLEAALPGLPYPLSDRRTLQQTVDRIGAAHPAARVEAFVGDVRDPRTSADAVAAAEQRFGGLDVAVAAAGVIGGGRPHWELDPVLEQAVIDIDLGGVLHLARAAVPALLRRPEPRHGRFVAVASAAATRGLPMLAAYCAAKSGVAGFIRALGVELGDTGVTANAVSPGSTATRILDESARLYDLTGAEAFAAQQPQHRLLDPDEVAAAIEFLASEASGAMTGAVIPVDAGLAL